MSSNSMIAFPRFSEHTEPHEIVFQLAKSGRIRHLKQFLSRKTKEERKRIVSIKSNGATSLIMACRNGHSEIVEYLVEHCGANLEQTGLVNFEGENIEGAPPLWCASAAGHLKIVKYLVSKGANVNSTTKSNSTALRAACFDGHVEIVKFLCENNADIEIANRHGHTCLMIACYKGHCQIAKYLISKGADLNRKSVKGNTALHDCAECGSLEIMKLLLSQNAKMAPDAYQMTPLLAAAVTGHATIVEYLLTRPECEPLEKISALELLGATFVDKKHDMLSAYNYWKAALERRNYLVNQEDGTKMCLDKNSTLRHNPIEAYDFSTEFMNEKELDDIISDPDDVRMQALLIRERILGPTHPDTTYYIRYRGAVYADCGNFRKCILLWLYALDTQQKSLDPLHPMIQSSFLSFTELFQYMQKQLPTLSSNLNHVNSASTITSSRDTANDSTSFNDSNGSMINMLNMYTTTVIKILQQAVEEVKRGLNLIQQYNQQKSNNNNNNSEQHQQSKKSLLSSNNINQIQKQHIQSSLVYNKVGESSENSNSSSSSCSSSSCPSSPSPSCSTLDDLEQASNPSSVSYSPNSNFNESNKNDLCLNNENATTSSSSNSTSTSTGQQNNQSNFELAHFDRTLVVIVHFLVVVAESLKHCSPEETYKLKKLVYELIKLNPKNSKNSTLLHLASSRESSSIIKNHTLSSFPSAEVLKLLLECGADPNYVDGEGNTALHLAASNRNYSISTSTANMANSNQTINTERDKIICLLLNSGTHLDTCNAFSKTASDLYKGGKMYQVVNPINYLTLQCLAAKVIQKYKLPYKEHLTNKLANFVSIH